MRFEILLNNRFTHKLYYNAQIQTIHRIRRNPLQRLAKTAKSKTIQGTLIKAGEEIFGSPKLDIQGSGRTDSGVHALCQVAHLEVKTMLAPEIMRFKFNDKLPHDINILEIEKASPNFSRTA